MVLSEWLDIVAIGAGFVGLIVTQVTAWRVNLRTQRAQVYMSLETEANRVFEILRTNPNIVAKLSDETFQPTDPLDHDVEWFLPQALNLFEVAIRYNSQKIFERAVFATWLAWFFEVAEYRNFESYWVSYRGHYRPKLRQIMDAGIRLSRKDQSAVEKMEAFFAEVAKITDDPKLAGYCRECEIYHVPKIIY